MMKILILFVLLTQSMCGQVVVKNLRGNNPIDTLPGSPISWSAEGVIFRAHDGNLSTRINYGSFTQEALDQLSAAATNGEEKDFVKPHLLTDEQRNIVKTQNARMQAAHLAEVKSKDDAVKKAAADKSLKWNQSQADKGDAFGQYRMGQRYLNGEGVAMDQQKAREWFAKSAEQGHADAKSELEKLP